MSTLNTKSLIVTQKLNTPAYTDAQRDALTTAIPGSVIYNSEGNSFQFYDGEKWLGGSGGGLFDFTTATFTAGGLTGRNGPSLTQARSGLTGPEANTWKNDTLFFNTSNGIQLWTVPKDGVFRIECAGAQGGNNSSYSGGPGYQLRCDFTLTQGLVLKILVGQRGNSTTGSNCDVGSGGGTFVATNTNTPIIVAGGGSGASYNTNGKPGQSGENGGQGDNSGGQGGTGGNGGFASTSGSSGGGGFFGNGANQTWSPSSGNGFGFSFTNGGTGGATMSAAYAEGGFGGGAGGHGNCYIGSGGAGGYSGGGGGGYNGNLAGGGGGSFTSTSFSATNRVNIGTRNGDGYVTITFIS